MVAWYRSDSLKRLRRISMELKDYRELSRLKKIMRRFPAAPELQEAARKQFAFKANQMSRQRKLLLEELNHNKWQQ